MSFGNQPQQRRSGLTTAGKWMFFVGLVLSVITGIVVAWGAVQAAGFYNDLTGDTRNLEGGTATVAMEEGDTRFVLNEVSDGQDVTCTVTGPDGNEQPLSTDSQVSTQGGAEAGAEIVGTFAASSTGEHVFTCEGGSPVLSPNLSGTAIIGTLVAALGALVLIPLGLITIIGLIMWLVGRGRDRRAQQAPAGHGQGGHGQGGYGQGGYEQGGYGQSGYGQSYPSDQSYPGSQEYPGSPEQPGQSGTSNPGSSSPYLHPGPEDDTRR